LILGETVGTLGVPQPLQPSDLDGVVEYGACQDGDETILPGPPARILAKVYYPFNPRDHRAVPTLNPLRLSKGPFPVFLYAHGYRAANYQNCATAIPFSRDFTSADALLRHVTSHGCVCVAPDLSWLPATSGAQSDEEKNYSRRATILAQAHAYLASLNASLFAQQLNASRVVVAGHSVGGGSAVQAGRVLANANHLQSLAYGLIAPFYGFFDPAYVGPDPWPGSITPATRPLLVVTASPEPISMLGPQLAYAAGGTPKTLVKFPGGTHFGYTGICPPDNRCGTAGLVDLDGTILRDDQQRIAKAYLAALMRFAARDDLSMRPYLTGERHVGGLETFNVQVEATGFPLPRPTVGPSKP
jgi:hypothetical protein